VTIIRLCERENQSADRRGTEMSKAAGQTSTNTLSRVADLIDLSVEHKIKLDALEHVLKETNPPVHELYLGTIEKLRAQKAAELKKVLTVRLTSKLSES
jgi:hypothetical protein